MFVLNLKTYWQCFNLLLHFNGLYLLNFNFYVFIFFYVTFDIIVKSHEQPVDVSAIEMFYWIMIVMMIMIISGMMMMMTIITWR